MPEAVLEFKATDGAWYAGIAKFEGPYLRVHFEHFPAEEDEKWSPNDCKSPQDVKKMIRPASQPMQDSQCSGLRRGMFLCVACRRPGTECFEYYDAKLQQFHRAPHKRLPDGQECCMCEFEVEWLGGPLVHKRQFVTCGDICLRTPGDIEDDPVIKDYIADVKSLKISKSLSSIDTSEKDASLASKKRKMVPSDDERMWLASRGDSKEHIMSEIDQKGFNMSLQCGGSSKRMGDINVVRAIEPPLKKIHLNTAPKDKVSESGFNCGTGSAGVYVDVIHVDSDHEEEACVAKDVSPAKITEAFSHSKMNEGKKSMDGKMVNDDKKSHATSPIVKHIVDDDTKSQATSSMAKPLVDELSTHEFSGLSREQSFSCGGCVPACSCIALQKHCFKSESCECEAVGFIPISCHLINMCSHSKFAYRRCKHSSRQIRKSCNACDFSATSQVCDKVDHSQAGNGVQSQRFEAGGDTKESIKNNKWEPSCERAQDLFHCLLVENLERDISPAKALKVVRKVSSGAIAANIWPSLEYETTRRGYIVYKDSKAAEAAYLSFSAGEFIVTSSKGRPWIIGRHKLDPIQPYNICTVEMLKEENKEVCKKEIEDDNLSIMYKGTEEYTTAVGKQKLFNAQQEKLRHFYKKFTNEEKHLEALYEH